MRVFSRVALLVLFFGCGGDDAPNPLPDAPPPVDTPPAGDTVAPVPGAGLTFSALTTSSVTVAWGAATDDVTAPAALRYKLVRASTPDEVDTLAEAQAITGAGVVLDFTANTLTANATGLAAGTGLGFAVVVQDEAGNAALYTPATVATLASGAPTAGTGITFSNIGATDVTVNWGAATDDITLVALLQYKVVRAATTAEIDTLAEITAITSGGGLVLDFTANTTSTVASGLTSSSTFAFAVVVRDAEGNEAIYTPATVATLDVTAPTPGDPITFTNIAANSVTVNWGAATDDISAQANLEYKVVRGPDTASIDTLAEAGAITGAELVLDFTPNVTTTNATALAPSTTHAFAVVVRDEGGNEALYTPATVTTTNEAPVIDSTPPPAATEDTLYTYNATRTDADGPGQTWSLLAGHTCGGSIDSGTGVFTFTPAGPSPTATCVIAIQVCDGGVPDDLCGTQTTTIDITSVNDAPVIDSIAPTTATEDTLFTYNPTRDDTDGPGQTWSLLAAHTCGGSIVTTTGAFAFTPAGPVPPGSCVVAIQVCDGGTPDLCGSQTTTVTITAVNDAPTITSTAPPTATEDTLYTYNATRTDADGPGQTWSLLGTHTCTGSIVAATGVFTFTPAGPTPPASCVVAIQVCDGGTPDLCTPQTTTITITATNDGPSVVGSPPTTATEDVPYTFDFNVNDADGPSQIWTLLGSHTCGGSINAANGVVSFTIAGPVPPANCLLAVQVCDGGTPNLCATASTTITITAVNDAPTVTSTPPPTATEDTLYTYSATRSDPDSAGQTWSLLGTHTCTGSIVAATGVFTFTPAGPTPPASCVIAIQVCDGGTPDLCTPQTTTISITAVNDAPVITSSAPASATEDTLYTYSATRNDADGPAQIWTLLANHTCGGSIVAGTGVFTFTPAGPQPATSCVVAIEVCDGAATSLCATQTTTISVVRVNDAPTITSTAPPTATEDAQYTYNATFADGDGPSQTWTLIGGMHTCGGSIVAGTGVFRFTPVGPAPSPTCVVAIQVCDNGTPNLCDTQLSTVTINAVNDPPVINSIAPTTVLEDTQYTYSPTVIDADGPTQSWAILGSTNCPGASIVPTTGVFTFTAPGPVPIANCTATIRVCDEGTPIECVNQTFTVTITPVNDAPVINSTPPATATEDTLYTYNATRNDADGPAQAWTLLGTHTCGGSIGGATGVLTFTQAGPTPPANCTLAIRVCDNGSPNLCVNQTATITINAVNDPPVITNTPPTTATEDVQYTYTPTRTDADGPGQVWTLLGTHTCGGSIVGTTGVVTFTQVGNPSATCVVAVQVCDGGSPDLCDSVTATVAITANNDAPVNSVPGSQTTNEEVTLPIPGVSIADVDAGAANVRVQLTVTNGTVTITTAGLAFSVGDGTNDATMTFQGTIAAINTALASLSYTPAANFSGSSTLTIVTNDLGNTGGPAQSDTDAVTITVNAVNDAPINTVPGTQTTAEDTNKAIPGVSIADVDAGAADVQVTLQVTNGALTIGTTGLVFTTGDGTADPTMTFTGTIAECNAAIASLTYLPTGNFSGSATLTITTSDLGNTGSGGVRTDADSITITVTAVNDGPQITSTPPPTATEDVLYTYNAVNNDPDGPGQTWSTTAGNTCGTIVAATGEYTFTPAGPIPPTSCVLAIMVCDGAPGLCATQTATITINEVNTPPTITNTPPTTTVAEGDQFVYAAESSDPDGPLENWTLGPLNNCPGSTISTDGVYTFTPETPNPSSCTMDILVCDNASPTEGCDRDTRTVTITPFNTAPLITSQAPKNASVNVLYTYNPVVDDVDGPDQDWALLAAHTCGGTLDNATGAFAFTPPDGSDVSCVLAIQICDGGTPNKCASETTTVSIGTNQPPVINSVPPPDAFSGSEYQYFATAQDPDGPGKNWSVLVITDTCNGLINNDGLYTFTPNSLNDDTPCVIDIEVCDGGTPDLCNRQTTTITQHPQLILPP